MNIGRSRRPSYIVFGASVLSTVQWSAAAALAAMSIAAPVKAQLVGTVDCSVVASPTPVTATLNPDLSVDTTSLSAHRAFSVTSVSGEQICQDAQESWMATHVCQTLLPGESVGSSSWTARRLGSSGGAPLSDVLYLTPWSGQSSPPRSDYQVGDDFLGNSGSFHMWVLYTQEDGVTVSSGQYVGQVPVTAVVSEASWFESNDCRNKELVEYYAVPGSYTHTFVINIPEACSATIPTEINFGQIASTAVSRTATAQVITRCNSDDLKYNIYITGGTGTANDNLTMTDGAGGALTYGLYMDETRATPFQRTPMGASVDQDGPYTRSFDGHTATIYGQVPAQALPQAGAYSDVVTVHVEY